MADQLRMDHFTSYPECLNIIDLYPLYGVPLFVSQLEHGYCAL